ncbi:HeH/LEM domain-containing protein [Pantoea sp. UYEF8]|uniref:HeH/LEM domain-containing protein n=1 Tax=Pantoea sp. UYEF8 TaxID=1756394 RepID=UPI00266BC707
MTLPKNLVQPDYQYTYPSERPYADESTTALGAETIYDPTKSGADYGIKNVDVAVPVTAGGGGNGADSARVFSDGSEDMTVAQIKEQLDAKGIEYKASATKAELLELLNSADQ